METTNAPMVAAAAPMADGVGSVEAVTTTPSRKAHQQHVTTENIGFIERWVMGWCWFRWIRFFTLPE